jgi:hypothetical protein
MLNPQIHDSFYMSVITDKTSLQIGKTYAYVSNDYILGIYKGQTTPHCSRVSPCKCGLPNDTEIFLFSNGPHGKFIFEVGLKVVDQNDQVN